MEKIFLRAFRDFDEDNYNALCHRGYIRKRRFEKGQTIFRAGDAVSELGLVLSGCVHIENNDIWGNQSLLSSIGPGGVFAETFALRRRAMMVDAVAAVDTEILFLNIQKALDSRHAKEVWYFKLQQSILEMSVQKNLVLSTRIFCTTSKTIRGRLLVYLSTQAADAHKNEFDIPFDRQQLANYLNVDRSALSKELGRMKAEGLLDYHKNHFLLLAKHLSNKSL